MLINIWTNVTLAYRIFSWYKVVHFKVVSKTRITCNIWWNSNIKWESGVSKCKEQMIQMLSVFKKRGANDFILESDMRSLDRWRKWKDEPLCQVYGAFYKEFLLNEVFDHQSWKHSTCLDTKVLEGILTRDRGDAMNCLLMRSRLKGMHFFYLGSNQAENEGKSNLFWKEILTNDLFKRQKKSWMSCLLPTLYPIP